MARHHSSKKRRHHLSHAESERMLHDKMMKHKMRPQSELERYHEHAGEERHLHGYHPRRSYDMLRHERDQFNDEWRYDAEPEGSGPYMYDRTSKDGYAPAPYGPDVMAAREARSGGRRRQEMKDAGMIHEDPREIANLPQQVRIEPYPPCNGYTPEDIDDTLRGVDRQIDYDNDKKMRHFFPKKV